MERNGRIATAYFKVFKGGSINPNIKILKCNIGVFFRVFRLMTVVFVSFFPQLSPKLHGHLWHLALVFFSVEGPDKSAMDTPKAIGERNPGDVNLLGNLRGWKNLKIEALCKKGEIIDIYKVGPQKPRYKWGKL